MTLKSRRDRGFHANKELCQFLFKLDSRCVRSNSLPAEDYNAIKIGTSTRYLLQKKDSKKLGEEKNKTLSLDEVTTNNREEFGRSARRYVTSLLNAAHGLTQFTSDIVEGLWSFDLDIMLVDPLEQDAFCFKQFFSRFTFAEFCFTWKSTSRSSTCFANRTLIPNY